MRRRDLLDEVDLALDVGTPRGNDRGAVASTSIPSGVRRPWMSASASSARADVVDAARCASSTRGRLDRLRVHVDHAGRAAAPTRPLRTAPSRAPAPAATSLGSTPRSKRALASERRPSRFDVLAMPDGSKYADSSSTSVVAVDDLGRGAAHDRRRCPARRVRRRRSGGRRGRARAPRRRASPSSRRLRPAARRSRARRAGRGRTRAADGSVRASRSW